MQIASYKSFRVRPPLFHKNKGSFTTYHYNNNNNNNSIIIIIIIIIMRNKKNYKFLLPLEY